VTSSRARAVTSLRRAGVVRCGVFVLMSEREPPRGAHLRVTRSEASGQAREGERKKTRAAPRTTRRFRARGMGSPRDAVYEAGGEMSEDDRSEALPLAAASVERAGEHGGQRERWGEGAPRCSGVGGVVDRSPRLNDHEPAAVCRTIKRSRPHAVGGACGWMGVPLSEVARVALWHGPSVTLAPAIRLRLMVYCQSL
jgi:hypothetical protein